MRRGKYGFAALRPTGWLTAGDTRHAAAQPHDRATFRRGAPAHAGTGPSAKLEGGGWPTDTAWFLVERGVPVCARLGQTPQSAHALGGCRVQGCDEPAAQALHRQARE